MLKPIIYTESLSINVTKVEHSNKGHYMLAVYTKGLRFS